MVRYLKILVCLAFATAGACCGVAALPPEQQTESQATAYWFPVGEQCSYSVYWGWISVGRAVLSSAWAEDATGQRVLELTYRGKSGAALEALFPVDDQVRVQMDPVNFRPLRLEVNLHEGSHVRSEVTTFDYAARTATWHAGDKTKFFPIDENTRDPLSFLYELRRDTLHPGTNLTFHIAGGDGTGTLNVQARHREMLSLPRYGTVPCLKLTPSLKFGEMALSQRDMTAWVTDDNRRLCTRLEASLTVGSLTAVLDKVRNP